MIPRCAKRVVSSLLWTPERDLSASFVTHGPVRSHVPFEDRLELHGTLTAPNPNRRPWSSRKALPAEFMVKLVSSCSTTTPPSWFATTARHNRLPSPAALVSLIAGLPGRSPSPSSLLCHLHCQPCGRVSCTATPGCYRIPFKAKFSSAVLEQPPSLISITQRLPALVQNKRE